MSSEGGATAPRDHDPEAGELPKAFVVTARPLPATDLMAWVADRVAPYKKIREVEFVTTVPRSPTGKILRRLLSGRAAP